MLLNLIPSSKQRKAFQLLPSLTLPINLISPSYQLFPITMQHTIISPTLKQTTLEPTFAFLVPFSQNWSQGLPIYNHRLQCLPFYSLMSSCQAPAPCTPSKQLVYQVASVLPNLGSTLSPSSSTEHSGSFPPWNSLHLASWHHKALVSPTFPATSLLSFLYCVCVTQVLYKNARKIQSSHFFSTCLIPWMIQFSHGFKKPRMYSTRHTCLPKRPPAQAYIP